MHATEKCSANTSQNKCKLSKQLKIIFQGTLQLMNVLIIIGKLTLQ